MSLALIIVFCNSSAFAGPPVSQGAQLHSAKKTNQETQSQTEQLTRIVNSWNSAVNTRNQSAELRVDQTLNTWVKAELKLLAKQSPQNPRAAANNRATKTPEISTQIKNTIKRLQSLQPQFAARRASAQAYKQKRQHLQELLRLKSKQTATSVKKTIPKQSKKSASSVKKTVPQLSKKTATPSKKRDEKHGKDQHHR